MDILVDLLESNQNIQIKVNGEIDAYTAPLLKEKLASSQEIEGLNAVLDLTDVSYMDSTGLGVFVGFYKAVKANGGHVKIVGLSPRLKRLFDITGLGDLMDIETAGKGEKNNETI